VDLFSSNGILQVDWEDVLVEDLTGDVFKQRKDHLKKVCGKFSVPFKAEYFPLYGRDTELLNFSTTYFILKNRVSLLITLPKVASTAWSQFFINNNITHADDCTGRGCSRDQLNVMIQIRNPLERLLSAYRFLVVEEGWKYVKNYNKQIVRDWEMFTEKSMDISWPEFVDGVLNNSHFLGSI